MKYKSQILKDEFQNVLKLKNKTDQNLEDERKRFTKEIERNQNNINDSLTHLREYHEKKRKVITKIRTIMETSSNHENDLICKKLKKNKEEEYIRELSNLNYLIKNDITKYEEFQIVQYRNFITANQKNYNNIEQLSLSCTDEAIEKGRNKIIQLSIEFLERNKNNKENIRILEKMLDKK